LNLEEDENPLHLGDTIGDPIRVVKMRVGPIYHCKLFDEIHYHHRDPLEMVVVHETKWPSPTTHVERDPE